MTRQVPESQSQMTIQKEVVASDLLENEFSKNQFKSSTEGKERHRRKHLKMKLTSLWTGKKGQLDLKAAKSEDAKHKRHLIRFWKNKIDVEPKGVTTQCEDKTDTEPSSPLSKQSVFDANAPSASPISRQFSEPDLESLINETCTVIFRPAAANDEHCPCACAADDHCSFKYSPSPTAPLNVFGPDSEPRPCNEECANESFSFALTPTQTKTAIVVPDSPATIDSPSPFSLRDPADSALHAAASLTPVDDSSDRRGSAITEPLEKVVSIKDDTQEKGRWMKESLKEYCLGRFGRCRGTNDPDNRKAPCNGKSLTKESSSGPNIPVPDSNIPSSPSRSSSSFLRRWRHPKE